MALDETIVIRIVYQYFSPATYSWHGGSRLSNSSEFKPMTVTKKEYEEFGYSICDERFGP